MGDPISSTSKAVQLGVLQCDGNKVNTLRVTENIDTARKATYALFGSGLHGTNGLNPSTCRSIWNLHILPRLIHGLEICSITEKDILPAEIFCRDICKQILGLPKTTPTPAVYFLFGILPVLAEIHRKTLTLFQSIASRPTSREASLALRQLTHKAQRSSSWFTYVNNVLHKYGLPTAYEVLANPPAKQRWKTLLKRTITLYWETSLRSDVIGYKSLRYFSFASMHGGCLPAIWTCSAHSIHETTKASIKCKLLVGTYPLQSSRRQCNQYMADQTCFLCGDGDEDLPHFLTSCAHLQDIRDSYLPRIFTVLSTISPSVHAPALADTETIVQLMLDCSRLIRHPRRVCQTAIQDVERISRDYIYVIHCVRQKRLKELQSTCTSRV